MLTRTRDRSGSGLPASMARLWRRWRSWPRRGILATMPAHREGLPEYWTPARAAIELGVHRQTVHDWMASGRLRPVAIAYETRERIVYLFNPDDVRRAASKA